MNIPNNEREYRIYIWYTKWEYIKTEKGTNNKDLTIPDTITELK